MKTAIALGLAAAGALGITPTLSGFSVPFISGGYTPPAQCVQWYDGCNMCTTGENGHASCTSRVCTDRGRGFCIASATSTSSD